MVKALPILLIRLFVLQVGLLHDLPITSTEPLGSLPPLHMDLTHIASEFLNFSFAIDRVASGQVVADRAVHLLERVYHLDQLAVQPQQGRLAAAASRLVGLAHGGTC